MEKVAVVSVAGSMASPNVTVTLVVAATPVALSAGTTNVTVGATVSIVQALLAGEASSLPTLSVAFTWKVCAPSARPV
jgi:hypothetical protein